MDMLLFDRRILLLIPALILPFLAAALLLRACPTRRAVLLLLLPAACSPFLFLTERALLVVFVLDLLLGVVFLWDLFSLSFRQSGLHVARRVERIASLAKRHEVTLQIENRTEKPLTLTVRDDAGVELDAEPAEFKERVIPPKSRETLVYQICPRRRGRLRFESVYLRAGGVFGLWNRYLNYPVESDLHVYPDMKQIDQYELLAKSDRLYQLGVRRMRKIGQDNDFERLRDYGIDDNFKQIDWRATAKRNKLTVKDFQITRNQRLVFLLDCGRMMANRAAGLSLLDHSINAMLMLAYVALRQGDAVGVLCFSNRILRYIAPQPGRFQMNRLLHACHDIFPEQVETRFDDAFYYLNAHCRKRSLVTLVSSVNDPINSERIDQHLTRLIGRHLPMGVFLRDRALFKQMEPFETSLRELRADTRIDDYSIKQALVTGESDRRLADRQMWKAAAAAEIINTRHQAIFNLACRGAITLDLFPEELTAPLINKYLEIKARHLL